MDEINTINIPAYQRKRSLAAKARKKPTVRKTATRKRVTPIRRTRETRIAEEMPLVQNTEFTFADPFSGASRAKPAAKDFCEMRLCGRCEGYFDKINVAVIKITNAVRVDDILIFEKDRGLFQQKIDSMQIDRKDVKLARAGSDIGLKVLMKPKVGTPIYKVI